MTVYENCRKTLWVLDNCTNNEIILCKCKALYNQSNRHCMFCSGKQQLKGGTPHTASPAPIAISYSNINSRCRAVRVTHARRWSGIGVSPFWSYFSSSLFCLSIGWPVQILPTHSTYVGSKSSISLLVIHEHYTYDCWCLVVPQPPLPSTYQHVYSFLFVLRNIKLHSSWDELSCMNDDKIANITLE